MNLGFINPEDPHAVRRAFQTIQGGLGFGSSPIFAGLTLTGLTANSLMYSAAGGVITSLGAATDGQLPIGSIGAAPVLATLTGTTNQVNVANGAGSITLSTPQDIHVGASPTFVDLTLSDLSLGIPTYPTMLDFINTTVSVGWTSGGVVTDNEDGTVAVAAGTGYIKKTDSSIGELVAFDWSEDSSVALR